MEDKTFQLLERMYSEFRTELDEIKAGQKKLETILEHDIKNKLQTLHEREAANTEKLVQLDVLSDKLDYLAVSINA